MDVVVERIIDAPSPSILATIAKKLSIVAISRSFLAFEDQFLTADAVTRCWVTLLPLSSAGAWVDYVYAFVTFETVAAEAIIDVDVEAEASGRRPRCCWKRKPRRSSRQRVEETTAIPPVDAEELSQCPKKSNRPSRTRSRGCGA